jgi:predicted nucleic acid-binding Zn ribbon protein
MTIDYEKQREKQNVGNRLAVVVLIMLMLVIPIFASM